MAFNGLISEIYSVPHSAEGSRGSPDVKLLAHVYRNTIYTFKLYMVPTVAT